MIDELVLEELADGVCISDEAGMPLYLNSGAERLMGLVPGAPRSPICDTLCARFAGGGGFLSSCALRQHGSPEKAVTNHGRLGSVDLRVRCVRLGTALFDSWEIEKRFTLIEDATVETQLERMKEDWRSMVAHDLANPLTTIYGALRELEELPAGHPLQEGEHRLIEICARTCKRLNQMLEMFLQVSRLESGMMPVIHETVDLKLLVQACLDEQAVTVRGKSITLDAVLPEGLRTWADRNLLSRVVQNLLNNALKFTPDKGRITISIAAGEDGGSVLLSVRDTGPGIPRDDIPHIFDRFYQVRGGGDRPGKGNGLGLAFCRQALAAMGGEIHVESALRLGTEFVVRLPRVA